MSIPGSRPRSLEPSYLEPKFSRETVLVDVVHRIVAVPAADHEHRVVADNRCVPEPVQRLGSLRLDHFPLVLLLLERASVEVVVPVAAIVACKDVQGAVVEHHSVVCARARRLSLALDS